MKKYIFPLVIILALCMGTIEIETAEVPIIMYHLVTENSRYIGKFGITPSELESDLQYLKENGYETVTIADLISFVEDGNSLPEKPIVLTFDDGNSSDYRYLYPLLQKYEMKAVLSILGKANDECTVLASTHGEDAKFPNLTWAQIKELSESPLIELQNHSYDLHGKRGSGSNKGEPIETYKARLSADLQKMQQRIEEMTGEIPTTFTYPLGIISDGSEEVLQELGFTASLSCQSGMNKLSVGDTDGLYRLKRSNRPSGTHVSTLISKMK